MNWYRLRKRLVVVRMYATAALFLLVILLPIVWLLIVALLPDHLLVAQPPILDFREATMDGFGRVVFADGYLTSVQNSAIIAITTTIMVLLASTLAAYAFARLRFRGRGSLLLGILIITMLPGAAFAIPLFALYRFLGIGGTHLAIILAFTAFELPFAIWILRGFYLAIPVELESAARMDGCSRLGVLRHIVLPLAAPGLLTVGIMTFIGAWNEFFLALVLGIGKIRTVPVHTATFYSEYSNDIAKGAAGGILAALPVVLLALAFSRILVRGLTEGAVKR
jgi:ABC-type glycerol-3-phosphate transport system permease component